MSVLGMSPARVALVAVVVSATGCSAPAPPESMEELAERALVQIDGELSAPGLAEPVEVIRDEWGVPHIYAQNDEDLFFAQGYVMAQDRLWQMEMWRRWHEGRLAEIFGPEALDYDRRTRLMMFRGPWDETEWTSYHPDARRLFTAHANGVNAFIEQNRDNLPIEFQLTEVVPDLWTAETVCIALGRTRRPKCEGPCDQRDAARVGCGPVRSRRGQSPGRPGSVG